MADARELSALAELIHAFVEEGIRFQIAGMSAAILQGVPATTLDTDLWIDLPERKHVRVLAVCRRLGATILARTVVSLRDDTLVNFLYRVDGLADFDTEAKLEAIVFLMGSDPNPFNTISCDLSDCPVVIADAH